MMWWAFIVYWVPMLFAGVAICISAALSVGMLFILWAVACG